MPHPSNNSDRRPDRRFNPNGGRGPDGQRRPEGPRGPDGRRDGPGGQPRRSSGSFPRTREGGAPGEGGPSEAAPMREYFSADRARSTVMNALARQAAEFPNFTLTAFETEDLSDRDAAFAHAVYDAVIRRWITLGYLIEQYTPRPFRENEPQTQAALLAGAAQMIFMDKVPPHAAINASVEWVKNATRSSVGGFVNAVLRKVGSLVATPGESPMQLPERTYRPSWANRADEIPLSDGRALVLRAAVLPPDPIIRLAIATSHPSALVQHWCETFGFERAQQIVTHDLCDPPTTLCTTHAWPPITELCTPHRMSASSVFTGGRDELATLLAERSDVWVQDAASSLAVQRLRAWKSGTDWVGEGVIIDVCAGQGTKTRQLAAAFPKATIIAADPAPERARTLTQVAAKIGPRVKVVPLPEVYRNWQAKAALVLLDVPCTNLGVLARRVEAKYRFDEAQTQRLVETQRQILESGIKLLSPKGVLCYSTCSIDPAENVGQLDWVLAGGDLKLEWQEQTLPGGLPGEDPAGYHDGAFAAMMVRM